MREQALSEPFQVGYLCGRSLPFYGLEDEVLVSSNGQIQSRSGLFDGETLCGITENTVHEAKFWDKFFESVSVGMPRPNLASIVRGAVDGGQWTPDALSELLRITGFSFTDDATPEDQLRGEKGGLGIVLCGHSEMKKVAGDLQSNKMVANSEFIDVGQPPPRNSYYREYN